MSWHLIKGDPAFCPKSAGKGSSPPRHPSREEAAEDEWLDGAALGSTGVVSHVEAEDQ